MLEIEADEVAKATNFCFYDQKINVSCNVRTIKLFKWKTRLFFPPNTLIKIRK